MITYTIPRSEYASIYDIASGLEDRVIKFKHGCKYAVVLGSYYQEADKGYTTHKTIDGVLRAAKSLDRTRTVHSIIDTEGNVYSVEERFENGRWVPSLRAA